jgi:hypothetical protein
VDVAGEAGVGTVGAPGDLAEGLLEDLRRGNSFGEGDGLIAEPGFGVEKDGLVDKVLAEERAVEVRAAFEQDAEDVAFGESGESGGQAEASIVVRNLVDFDVE